MNNWDSLELFLCIFLSVSAANYCTSESDTTPIYSTPTQEQSNE